MTIFKKDISPSVSPSITIKTMKKTDYNKAFSKSPKVIKPKDINLVAKLNNSNNDKQSEKSDDSFKIKTRSNPTSPL